MPRPTAATASRKTLVLNELLDRASELFAEQGYDATSLQDIAQAMGMSRQALYHYVKSKDDVLVMLVEGQLEDTVRQMRTIVADADLSAAEKVRAITVVQAGHVGDAPSRFRLLIMSEASLPPKLRKRYVRARHAALDLMREVIHGGVLAGEFRAVDDRLAAFGLIGMVNWMAWWYDPAGSITVDEVCEHLADLAIASLVRPDTDPAVGGIPGALKRLRAEVDAIERMADPSA